VRLLIFNGKLASQTTYIDLMDFAFGRPGRIAISIFSFIFAFGGRRHNTRPFDKLWSALTLNFIWYLFSYVCVLRDHRYVLLPARFNENPGDYFNFDSL